MKEVAYFAYGSNLDISQMKERIREWITSERVYVELKATISITKSHEGQTYAYLRVTGLKRGLIINFPYPEKEEPEFKIATIG